MTEAVIEAHGLTKKFGTFTAVDNVSMSIERGTVHGFLGPNGSGKTTTIRMMCGLMHPSSGSVQVLGLAVPEQAATVRQHVGYMTQRFSLYEDLTVIENLGFLARIHGLSASRKRERIAAVMEQCHLGPLGKRRVGPLSGGQKRRLALASALITEPELLLLDEPTSEVDPNTRRDMWEGFFNLAESGTTILVSTHLMDEAERCHRLTIMNQGAVVADGSVASLTSELPGQVFVVRAERVTRLVPRIAAINGVVAVTQVGNDLRVLASHDVVNALSRELPHEASVLAVAARVEDVFVHATRGGRRA